MGAAIDGSFGAVSAKDRVFYEGTACQDCGLHARTWNRDTDEWKRVCNAAGPGACPALQPRRRPAYPWQHSA